MADLYGNVNIIETVQITPEGKIVKIFRVSARSRSGVTFTLEIPATEFTQAGVKKALESQARLIEDIKGL